MKKIFFALVVFFFGKLLFAQQKDTVMWFVGHWKDKKTFIIDSNMTGGAGGGTVTTKNDGSTRITTPENKKFDNKINKQSLIRWQNTTSKIFLKKKAKKFRSLLAGRSNWNYWAMGKRHIIAVSVTPQLTIFLIIVKLRKKMVPAPI